MPKKVRMIRWVLIIAGGGILSLFVLLFLLALMLNFTLPSVAELADMNLEESTIIYDREGNQLYAIHGEENRIMTDLPDISDYLVEATIATEDDDFYSHPGFDIKSLSRALINNILGKPISGASTITQQFIKIKYLSPEKSYIRKFKELILAIKLEIFFSKDEILEMYLNEIPYGNNAYGAELAAEVYFDKKASELTLAESAILAAIPNAPTYYSPYGNHTYSTINVEFTEEMLADREIATEDDLNEDEYSLGLIGQTYTLSEDDSVYIKGRVDIVLERMVKEGYITESQMLATLEDVQTVEFAEYRANIAAPHFVFYVKEALEEKYGTELVEQGGLKVYTTLDPTMQDYAEEAVETYKNSNLENYGASNSALVAIQPETGQILAMVGSAEYGNEDIAGSVNMATSLRQPGSSFKPIVYALAFLNGVLSPATVLYDVQTYFGTDSPQDYSGTFKGPVSVREAIGQSLNLPAIKAFFLAGGEEAVVDFAETLGITTLNHDGNYGWPLALGAGEVTLLELVNTYAVFASQGNYLKATAILKIENANGEIIEQWEGADAIRVLDPEVAYLITNVLSDTTYRLGSNLTIDGQINAAKTGTSDKKIEDGTSRPNNCLALGYTTSLVAGVWTGNADGSVMYGNADGYTTSAPIWKYFMTKALEGKAAEEFPRPGDIKDMAISIATGKLPSENTPSEAIKTDIFASFAIPTELDNSYVKIEIDSESGKLATEFTPEESKVEKVYRIYQETFSEYANWVSGVERWLTEKVSAGEIELPPTEYDDIHTSETVNKQPTITIVSPSSLSTIETGTTEIEVEITAENGVKKVEFYTNDNLQYTSTEAPYTGRIRLASTYSTTTIEVTAKVYDTYGYTAESTIELKITKSSSDSEL
ncbi:MAG: penicillin-binding protein [Candidatus Peregrinibacteria bacterium GW2011_GWF2_43_17]|nr:MAG: penicillin-binding protein [Candidatus Peregrinibacteria bacterium GW2011_GWF2_43_17]